MPKFCAGIVVLSVLLGSAAVAENIKALDFANIHLGATIVGPVGPEVEASLVGSDGRSNGDINSRVQCPPGVSECKPPMMPAGTIYTYIHEITPGADRPNDKPFPKPDHMTSVTSASQFALGMKAEGFNGAAGYSFDQAKAGTGQVDAFKVNEAADGSLVWTLAEGAVWPKGATVTFFWQTTQPPKGPGKGFTLSTDAGAGIGHGPAPKPVQ